MHSMIHALLILLLASLFLYSKLLPYKSRLYPQYGRVFGFFDQLFGTPSGLLRKIFKPVAIGPNLSIDMAQVLLFFLLLTLLQIF